MVPFFDGDVDDVGDTDAIAGVCDEDVRTGLVVVSGDLLIESADVCFGSHVDLMGRDWGRGAVGSGGRGGGEVGDQLVDGSFILGVGQGEVAAMAVEVAGAGGTETACGSAIRLRRGETGSGHYLPTGRACDKSELAPYLVVDRHCNTI